MGGWEAMKSGFADFATDLHHLQTDANAVSAKRLVSCIIIAQSSTTGRSDHALTRSLLSTTRPPELERDFAAMSRRAGEKMTRRTSF